MTAAPRDLAAELDELRERLDRLESAGAVAAAAGASADAPHRTDTSHADPFWALTALKERLPAPGGVVFAGAVGTPAGPVEWQYGLSTDAFFERDWGSTPGPTALAALGSPVRLRFLQSIAGGVETVAQLAESEEPARPVRSTTTSTSSSRPAGSRRAAGAATASRPSASCRCS
ncbi:hypothetical protein Q0F99_09025 [Rathayibacter oskolensis]|uniref:hypothetical protein n=1 Tax=Rathayibacter oskolensis TaxID=1891671 RepID=UPI00265FA2A0|nr:hypothetical protein [Rathayibacter oskolensis]WKK72984.1 hypothetical protein Q0F99_09025 [Rathayibacter oskolensis]